MCLNCSFGKFRGVGLLFCQDLAGKPTSLKTKQKRDAKRKRNMAKLVHVQTVLTVEDVEALKAKTGETSVKDAVAKAVNHYLECEQKKGNEGDEAWAKKLSVAIERRKQKAKGN